MKQVERIDVVGLHVIASDAHHQHKIHKPVGGVARDPQTVQGDLTQRSVDVAVGNLLDGPPIEVRVRSVWPELARTAQLE